MLPKLAAAAAVAVITCLGVTVSGLPIASAAPGAQEPEGAAESATSMIQQAPELLATAAQDPLDVLEAAEAAVSTPADPVTATRDTSLALRSLRLVRDELPADQRRRANRVLARPTNGASDPLRLGYSVPAKRACSQHFCVHWVDTTVDRVPHRAWVDTTLSVLETVRTRTKALGWPDPAPDGTAGGDARLDVYLKDLGSRGEYGRCTMETIVSRPRAQATSYCVLDNDFSPSQFRQDPLASLKATAAHEYLHAVQFNMDFLEDAWLLESMATWMEEQIFDGVNDNRQYLPSSVLRTPRVPLDTLDNRGRPYSAWLLWDYLAKRFGQPVALRVMRRAAATPGATSMAALRQVFRAQGFAQVYSDFIAASALPARFWPEGRAYGRHVEKRGAYARAALNGRMSATVTLNHLSGMRYRVRPGRALPARGRLKVTVRAGSRGGAAATVLVRRASGKVVRRSVPIGRKGTGSIRVDFGRGKNRRAVTEVVVAVTNGSSTYHCFEGTDWACSGTPTQDRRKLSLTLRPVA